VLRLARDRIAEPKAKRIARTLGASCTNLPIVWGAKIEVLPLSASSEMMRAVKGIINRNIGAMALYCEVRDETMRNAVELV